MRAANNLNSIVPHNNLVPVPLAGATTDLKPSGREVELKFLVSDDAFKTIRQATLLGADAGRGAPAGCTRPISIPNQATCAGTA
jgi:hypothetical protein